MRSEDLIDTARYLVDRPAGKPRQTDVKRSLSTVYYAIFHELAKNCADTLIGGKSAERTDRAWTQVYRSLEHGFAASQCANAVMIAKFPKDIQTFANQFVALQTERHRCDYDPNHRTTKTAVQTEIATTEIVIANLRSVKPKHRRAFSAYVLFKPRR